MNKDIKESKDTLEKISNLLVILPSIKEDISSHAETLNEQGKEYMAIIDEDVKTLITKLSPLDIMLTN
jgi:hypothetical protein